MPKSKPKKENQKNNSNFIRICIGVLLLLVGLGLVLIFSKKNYQNPNLAIKSKFGSLIDQKSQTPSSTPTPTLTPCPLTPTPTLTPEQIAEIKRKKFEEWNAKYGPCRWVPILMYHHVMDPDAAKEINATNLNVATNTFREQMDYLLAKGYSILRLDEMMAGLRSGSLPAKPVVLTFDDGYRDFYDNVFPILREKGIKATVFAISQFVGGPRYVEWWQLREMSGSGLVLVGDHTLNHLSLPKLSIDEQRNQIVSAKKILEDYVGQKVEYFAYPYGSYNGVSEQVLKENGFGGAVTTTNVDPQCVGLPYQLSRIRIGGGSMSRYGL